MSSTQRFLALSLLVTTPYILASCSEDAPDDDGASGAGTAGTGNQTAGTGGAPTTGGDAGGTGGAQAAGKGGGGTGPAGAGGSVAGAGGSVAGAGGSTAGAGTGGSAGAAAGAGASTTGGAGAGGSGGGAGGATGGAGAAGAGGALGGAGSGGAGGSAGGAGGTGGGTGAFTLTSSKLTPDEEMSADFTCEGDAHSPPFEWTGAPAGTMSFAMLFVDMTIAATNMDSSMAWHHAIWDIPASATGLPEDMPTTATVTTPVACKQFNPLQCDGYLGPCAQKEDEYEFRLYALPVATLSGQLNSVIAIRDAIMAAEPLGEAKLPVKANASGTLSCPK